MEKVIKFHKQDNIGMVALEEREYANTFTHRFIQGLMETFALIDQDQEIKVVVLHGYDNYFCCGGTKEELLALHESAGKKEGQGKIRFSDLNFYDLLLRCQVPVISAMQGHALGAGFTWGCSADIVVLAEQCIYSANFMKYGFTPGFGATYLLPRKLGEMLGTEMLYTARNYYGRELKERGAPVNIVPKQEVIATALEIAKHLADKPLLPLKVLKNYLTHQIRTELPEVIKKELEMHEITFGQPEVLERIQRLFAAR
jgi:polyketide biosynthesis enoyl-CoA hydratase PksI